MFVGTCLLISFVAQSVGLVVGAAMNVQNGVFLAPVMSVWENMADGDDDKEDQKFAVCINSFRKYLIVLVFEYYWSLI